MSANSQGTKAASQRKGPEGLRAVERSVAILFALSMHPEGISLAELSRETGITMTTVHRMLAALRGSHLVRETPTGLQSLGLGTLVLSGAFLEGLDVRTEAHPFLMKLRDKTNETCHLGSLASSQIVYIDKIDSRQTVRMTSRVGGTSPAIRTAMGKAILAHSSEEVVQDVLRESSYQQGLEVDAPTLRAELDRVRADGYSTDLEDQEPGICCVGAAIMDSSRRVVAGISVSTPSARFDRDNVAELGDAVCSAADEISEALGYLSSSRKAAFERFAVESRDRLGATET